MSQYTRKQEGERCRYCSGPLLHDGTCYLGECVALEEVADLEAEIKRIKEMFVRYIHGLWPTGYEVKEGIFSIQEINEIASWVMGTT